MKLDISSLSQVSEITDNLYLCAARALRGFSLQAHGVTCVINAAAELPSLPLDKVEYIRVSVLDSPLANLYSYFDSIADKIEDHRRKGGKTLVHCMAGVSRSASLCLAYMMKYRNMTLRQAYTSMKARRPVVRPNPGFFQQLLDYEKKLSGRQTVRLLPGPLNGLPMPDVYLLDEDSSTSHSVLMPTSRTTSTSHTTVISKVPPPRRPLMFYLQSSSFPSSLRSKELGALSPSRSSFLDKYL